MIATKTGARMWIAIGRILSSRGTGGRERERGSEKRERKARCTYKLKVKLNNSISKYYTVVDGWHACTCIKVSQCVCRVRAALLQTR